MKKVLVTFVGYWQDDDRLHNLREFSILSSKEIYLRSNDLDGEQRYYIWPIKDFELKFHINIGNLMIENNINF